MLSSVNSHQCCGASPFLPAPVPAPIKRSRLTSTAIFLLLFKTPNLLSLYKKNYFIFKNLFFDLLIINVADRNFLFHLSWSRTFKPAPEHGLSPLFFTFLHVQKIQRYPHACFFTHLTVWSCEAEANCPAADPVVSRDQDTAVTQPLWAV